VSAPPPCEVIGLDRVYELSCELSRRVRAAGFAPDLVVAVARGGFVPARLVCDFLDVRDLASLGVRHYAPGARAEARARVSQPVNAELRGRRVLLVDDVNDSGETLEVARAHLAERSPRELRLAVLHEKAHTRVAADFRAAAAGADRWLVYQWALCEDVRGFLERLDPTPATPDAARARLAELGLALDAASWSRIAETLPAA
jgi:hypoxanthine phosphoribosyltransferase